MKVKEFVIELNKLVDEGHGDKEMFSCHGASGAIDPIGYPYFRKGLDATFGPFDLDGDEFVEVYIGN
jgi:hypothetical protein